MLKYSLKNGLLSKIGRHWKEKNNYNFSLILSRLLPHTKKYALIVPAGHKIELHTIKFGHCISATNCKSNLVNPTGPQYDPFPSPCHSDKNKNINIRICPRRFCPLLGKGHTHALWEKESDAAPKLARWPQSRVNFELLKSVILVNQFSRCLGFTKYGLGTVLIAVRFNTTFNFVS